MGDNLEVTEEAWNEMSEVERLAVFPFIPANQVMETSHCDARDLDICNKILAWHHNQPFYKATVKKYPHAKFFRDFS